MNILTDRKPDGGNDGTGRTLAAAPARAAWWAPVALLALVAAAYGQTLGFDLLLDDHFHFIGNPLLRGRVGWWDVVTSPTSAYFGEMFGADRAYRPLLALIVVADHAIWGTQSGGYHLSGVLAHLAVVLLLWRLAWHLTGNAWAAMGAGSLLAVHPSAVEAVAFVSAQMDVFVGLGMAAVLLLLRGSLGPGGARRLVGALLCFAFALGSKETALAIPAIVAWAAWTYPVWFAGAAHRPSRAGLAARVAPFWLAAGLYGVLRQAVIGALAPAPIGLREFPAQIPRALVAIGTYVEMTLASTPATGFIVVGKVPPPRGLADPRVLFGLAAVGLLLGGLLWLRRRLPSATFALGSYAAALVPASNLLPIYWEHAVYVTERSLYPALVFWCLFLAVSVHALFLRWERRTQVPRNLLKAMGGAGLGTLLVVTFVNVGAWRDEMTLWTAAAAAHPDSVEVRLNLASALAQAGNLQGADANMREASARLPDDPNVAYMAGVLAQSRGQTAEALRQYERSVALGAGLERVFRGAAGLAAELHEWDRACRWFIASAERFSRAAWPQVGLGWCRQREGRTDLARTHFERAEALEPHSPERSRLLGNLYAVEGRLADAAEAYRASLALDPSYLPARAEVALLAEREGRLDEAIALWRAIAADLPAGQHRALAISLLRRTEVQAAGRAAPSR